MNAVPPSYVRSRALGAVVRLTSQPSCGTIIPMSSVNASAPARGALDRFFKISERGSTLGREIRGGLVTFLAMSYILVLNPLILGTVPDGTGQMLGGGTDGPNLAMIASATALIAGIMSILMGAIANFPLALAAGLEPSHVAVNATVHTSKW